MYLLTLLHPSEPRPRVAVRTANGVVDLATAATATAQTDLPTTLDALLSGGTGALEQLRTFVGEVAASSSAPWVLREEEIRYGPCVLHPEKIICVGLNYRRHAEEAGLPIPDSPVLFSKFNNALAAAGERIPLPAQAREYDYEVELGVVIGREARGVGVEEALDYVFGYCTVNDLSARDLQRRTSQWLLGKTLDKFMPVGPYLVTADEIDDPQSLRLRCWVNGELRQDSNSGDMIFSVAELVSYISQYMTLKPGDLISTGTPEGVILGMAEQRWLVPGDEVTVEIERVGRLTNVLE